MKKSFIECILGTLNVVSWHVGQANKQCLGFKKYWSYRNTCYRRRNFASKRVKSRRRNKTFTSEDNYSKQLRCVTHNLDFEHLFWLDNRDKYWCICIVNILYISQLDHAKEKGLLFKATMKGFLNFCKEMFAVWCCGSDKFLVTDTWADTQERKT